MANDGYAGAVSPGGPSNVRELPRLTIRKCSVSSFDNNAYLLTCRSTGAQLLVDAAADPDRLRALLHPSAKRVAVTGLVLGLALLSSSLQVYFYLCFCISALLALQWIRSQASKARDTDS